MRVSTLLVTILTCPKSVGGRISSTNDLIGNKSEYCLTRGAHHRCNRVFAIRCESRTFGEPILVDGDRESFVEVECWRSIHREGIDVTVGVSML